MIDNLLRIRNSGTSVTWMFLEQQNTTNMKVLTSLSYDSIGSICPRDTNGHQCPITKKEAHAIYALLKLHTIKCCEAGKKVEWIDLDGDEIRTFEEDVG